jgi:hypothetical protein
MRFYQNRFKIRYFLNDSEMIFFKLKNENTLYLKSLLLKYIFKHINYDYFID